MNSKNITRAYMEVISGHLEGCLLNLTPAHLHIECPPHPRLGDWSVCSKASGVIAVGLADHLWEFNKAVNVSSKHFDAYMPTRRLNERTFSVMETANALVLMRKLSTQSVKELLAREKDDFIEELVEFVPAGDMPEYRDVTLVLSQVKAGLGRFREKYRKYWLDLGIY